MVNYSTVTVTASNIVKLEGITVETSEIFRVEFSSHDTNIADSLKTTKYGRTSTSGFVKCVSVQYAQTF